MKLEMTESTPGVNERKPFEQEKIIALENCKDILFPAPEQLELVSCYFEKGIPMTRVYLREQFPVIYRTADGKIICRINDELVKGE